MEIILSFAPLGVTLNIRNVLNNIYVMYVLWVEQQKLKL